MLSNAHFISIIDNMIEAIQNAPPICQTSEIWLASLAAREGFIDGEFYLKTNPDIARASVDPALHYLQHGFREGRAPFALGSQKEWQSLLGVLPDMGAIDFPDYLAAIKGALAAAPQSKSIPCSETKPADNVKNRPVILRHGSSHAFYHRQLHVDWNITNMCNYTCSYRFSHDRKIDKRRFSSLEDLKLAVDRLASLNRPTYKITLSGGEPTIHPHFFDLLQYLDQKLAERLNYVLIISNGSRQGALYKELATLAKQININMLISLHTEHVDMDHILDLITNISEDITITFNLMFNPAMRRQVRQLYEILLEARKKYAFNSNIALLRIPPNYDTIDPQYTDEDFAWREQALSAMKETVMASGVDARQKNRLNEEIFIDRLLDGQLVHEVMPYHERDNYLKKGYFNFNGMKCAAGTAVVAIRPDGGIKGTQCSLTTVRHNIYKENPFLQPGFISLIDCTLKNCGCSANDSIPKFASKEEGEHFLNILSL